jgi:hypothetical protein
MFEKSHQELQRNRGLILTLLCIVAVVLYSTSKELLRLFGSLDTVASNFSGQELVSLQKTIVKSLIYNAAVLAWGILLGVFSIGLDRKKNWQ